jgi:hypothetical protein
VRSNLSGVVMRGVIVDGADRGAVAARRRHHLFVTADVAPLVDAGA